MNTIKQSRKTFETILSAFGESADNFDLCEVKEFLADLMIAKPDHTMASLEVLAKCCEVTDTQLADFTMTELCEKWSNLETAMAEEEDFWGELPCGEVRVIDEKAIDEIWTKSLIEMIKDCYDLSDVPSFVEIDWYATAENCKIDGRGHHFASYDEEEYECNGFYIFRTN